MSVATKGEQYWHSNEGQLNRTTDFTRPLSGTILAVGSSQGLDILVNSNCSGILFVDKSLTVHAVNKAVLEIAAIRADGSSEGLRKFYEDFEFGSLKNTRHLLSNLEEEEMEVAMAVLSVGLPGSRPSDELIPYGKYMQIRSGLKNKYDNPYTWCSSVVPFQKVAAAYEKGSIVFTRGDLCNPQTYETLREKSQETSPPISILYISNIEEHIVSASLHPRSALESLEILWEGLTSLSVNREGIILRTAHAFGYYNIGTVKESPGPLFHTTLDWHYNIEEIGHHLAMRMRDSRYINKGWLRFARAYKKQKLFPEKGVSKLDLETTNMLIHQGLVKYSLS